MNLNNITAETLNLAKSAHAAGGLTKENFAKSITTGTGLVAYDLQAPAKNIYPVLTPIRNRIPRVGGKGGTATNWRQVSATIGSGFSAMPWVPEGQRTARMSYVTATKSASYVTIGEEDQISFEAINAAINFEDERAMMTMRLLQKTMIKEEIAILAGNASMALGTPAAATTSASGTTGTLPALTYDVKVVALTMEGLLNMGGSLPGNMPALPYTPLSASNYTVPTSQTITGADGNTFVLNGGSSNISAVTTQAITLGQILFASTPVIPGAMAYAWYVGASGAATLQAITTINSVAISTALATGRQAQSAITGDASLNASYAFNGLIATAVSSGTGYVASQPTGTAGTGTGLTASGNGSVTEIDEMLKSMWDTYRLSPSVLYVNSQELMNIKVKVLGNATAPLVRFNMDDKTGAASFTAGSVIGFYFNPYTIDGGRMIPIRLHPFVPPGTLLGYAEDLPSQYQSNNVPNCVEMHVRKEYEELEWPIRTRQREHGVYAEEVLAVYVPFALGMITNIANA